MFVDKYYFVKEEIKKEINPLDLLESYNARGIRVRNGKVRSNCVIHDGNGTNNFSFDLNDKLWTCFSRHCGEDLTDKARDVFLFIKLAEEAKTSEACSFRKCLQIASDIAGLNIDIDDFHFDKEKRDRLENEKFIRKGKRVENKQIRIIDEDLIQEFINNYHPYIEQRGYEKEVVEKFELGYSKYGLNEEYIKHPKFPGRIIVPIRNETGELVGLSGRIATDNKFLIKKFKKYQNLINFDKGLVLYNLNNARDEIRRTRQIILCEGFFDVIRLNTFGINNAVAVMGSSLTPEQLSLCLTAHEAYICFDGDEAGRISSFRIAEQLKNFMNVYIVNLPDGKDPDSIEDPVEFWIALSEAERYLGKKIDKK